MDGIANHIVVTVHARPPSSAYGEGVNDEEKPVSDDLYRDSFDYKGWRISLEIANVGASGFAVGHADVHHRDELCCRIPLATPELDRDELALHLEIKASAYIDDCLKRISQREALAAVVHRPDVPGAADDSLWRLIYASRSPTLVDSDVRSIWTTSRRNNARDDITGALIFLDGVYMQYLEGPHDSVETLYSHIKVDKRHFLPKVLDRTAIDERAFPDWSMALLVWDEEKRAIVRGHCVAAELDLYLVEASVSALLFRELTNAEGWMAA